MNGSKIIRWMAVFLGLLTLYFSVYRIDETKQAVVTELGKPIKVEKKPGLLVKIPWLQQIHKFEKRLLEYDAAPRRCVTKDKKYIFLDNYARWKIVDPLLFMKTVRNISGAQSRLDDIIYSVVREEIGKYPFVEILRSSNREMLVVEPGLREMVKERMEEIKVGREKIMQVVTQKSDEMAGQYGIRIVDVRIKRADLPEANTKAVFERMKAERNRIASRYLSEGEGEKARILGEMEKELAIIRSEAYRKAEGIKGEADAMATRIYAQAYEQDADFFNFLKTLETYKKTLPRNTTILVPLESKFFKYIVPEEWEKPK